MKFPVIINQVSVFTLSPMAPFSLLLQNKWAKKTQDKLQSKFTSISIILFKRLLPLIKSFYRASRNHLKHQLHSKHLNFFQYFKTSQEIYPKKHDFIDLFTPFFYPFFIPSVTFLILLIKGHSGAAGAAAGVAPTIRNRHRLFILFI